MSGIKYSRSHPLVAIWISVIEGSQQLLLGSAWLGHCYAFMQSEESMNLAKLYTWVVGGLFLIAVGTTLALELVTRGATLEAGHKALHVLIGVWAVVIIVKKLDPQYRIFALTNGVLWGSVATVGWLVPAFTGSKPSTASIRSCIRWLPQAAC